MIISLIKEIGSNLWYSTACFDSLDRCAFSRLLRYTVLCISKWFERNKINKINQLGLNKGFDLVLSIIKSY